MITGITDDQSEVFIHGDQYGAPYSGHRKFESTPTCIGPCSNFNLDFNDVGHNFDFKFKLKLIVDIEFDELNDEGNNHKTTLLLTYDVDDDNVIISNTDIDPTSNGLPINLDINNLTFNGQQVDGCSLSGNKYVCKSVYDINVKDVNMSPGYEVEMIAGRAIYVDATSVFTPESLLRIANHPYYNHAPNTPISSTISFCTTNPNDDNHYHANQPTTRLEAYVDSLKNNDSDVNFKEKKKIEFTLFPNPTILKQPIQLTMEKDYNVISITFNNLMGQKINVRYYQDGINSVLLDSEGLAPGIYFVTVNCHEGSATKRLIIN